MNDITNLSEHNIVAKAHNLTNEQKNATQHCEIICIDYIESNHPEQRITDLVLFVTCEPCIMCAYALKLVGIKEVYYGCGNQRFGGNGSILNLNEGAYDSYGGYLESECIEILQKFYQEGNQNLEEQFRHRKSKQIKF